MSRIIFFLFTALIALGFLIANTITLVNENSLLKEENKQISQELVDLQSELSRTIQERDTFKTDADGMKIRVDVLTQAYLAEYQARQNAIAQVEELSRELEQTRQINTTPACPSDSPPMSNIHNKLNALSPLMMGTGLLGFLALIVLRMVHRLTQRKHTRNIQKTR